MRRPGEKMTWPENAWPRPDQWLKWFESLTPERKLEVAGQVCQNAEFASMCVQQDHVGQIISLMDTRNYLANRLVRLGNAYRSARVRARAYRSLIDWSNDHARLIKRWGQPSQSDPEALPTHHSAVIDQRDDEGAN
jgi:hypothetical protein